MVQTENKCTAVPSSDLKTLDTSVTVLENSENTSSKPKITKEEILSKFDTIGNFKVILYYI